MGMKRVDVEQKRDAEVMAKVVEKDFGVTTDLLEKQDFGVTTDSRQK